MPIERIIKTTGDDPMHWDDALKYGRRRYWRTEDVNDNAFALLAPNQMKHMIKDAARLMHEYDPCISNRDISIESLADYLPHARADVAGQFAEACGSILQDVTESKRTENGLLSPIAAEEALYVSKLIRTIDPVIARPSIKSHVVALTDNPSDKIQSSEELTEVVNKSIERLREWTGTITLDVPEELNEIIKAREEVVAIQNAKRSLSIDVKTDEVVMALNETRLHLSNAEDEEYWVGLWSDLAHPELWHIALAGLKKDSPQVYTHQMPELVRRLDLGIGTASFKTGDPNIRPLPVTEDLQATSDFAVKTTFLDGTDYDASAHGDLSTRLASIAAGEPSWFEPFRNAVAASGTAEQAFLAMLPKQFEDYLKNKAYYLNTDLPDSADLSALLEEKKFRIPFQPEGLHFNLGVSAELDQRTADALGTILNGICQKVQSGTLLTRDDSRAVFFLSLFTSELPSHVAMSSPTLRSAIDFLSENWEVIRQQAKNAAPHLYYEDYMTGVRVKFPDFQQTEPAQGPKEENREKHFVYAETSTLLCLARLNFVRPGDSIDFWQKLWDDPNPRHPGRWNAGLLGMYYLSPELAIAQLPKALDRASTWGGRYEYRWFTETLFAYVAPGLSNDSQQDMIRKISQEVPDLRSDLEALLEGSSPYWVKKALRGDFAKVSSSIKMLRRVAGSFVRQQDVSGVKGKLAKEISDEVADLLDTGKQKINGRSLQQIVRKAEAYSGLSARHVEPTESILEFLRQNRYSLKRIDQLRTAIDKGELDLKDPVQKELAYAKFVEATDRLGLDNSRRSFEALPLAAEARSVFMLLSRYIYPTQNLIAFLNQNPVDGFDRLAQLRTDIDLGKLDSQNSAQKDLLYPKFVELANKLHRDNSYEAFGKLKFRKNSDKDQAELIKPVVLTETEIKQADESVTALARLYWEIAQFAEQGKNVLVIGNERNGTLWGTDIIGDELRYHPDRRIQVSQYYVHTIIGDVEVDKALLPLIAHMQSYRPDTVFILDGTLTAKNGVIPRVPSALDHYLQWFKRRAAEDSQFDYESAFWTPEPKGKFELGGKIYEDNPPQAWKRQIVYASVPGYFDDPERYARGEEIEIFLTSKGLGQQLSSGITTEEVISEIQQHMIDVFPYAKERENTNR